MDDRTIRGIKHSLMQPLAPKASVPVSWQTPGWHRRGRIILLPRFYMLFPVHSPDTLQKTDKTLVWSRMAILTFWNGLNKTVACILFITRIVWSCFIRRYERTASLELQFLHSELAVQFISCWTLVVSHLYKPISSSILFHHNHYGFINLPKAPAKALVTLSIRKNWQDWWAAFNLLHFCW